VDRRRFLKTTTGVAGAFALNACGGGEESTATPGDGTTRVPPPASAPTPPGSRPSPPARPSPTPAIPLNSGSFVTWDAGSGPTKTFWSEKLAVRWHNAGTGDWLDANQRPQGAAPFAKADVSGTGPVTLDVAALVRRWVGGADNRGFYLRSDQVWPFTFAGRSDANPAARPRLSVVTDQGTFAPPCLVNANWSPASGSGRDSRASFKVGHDIWFAIVQFDLRGVRGAVKSARLTLNCHEMRYAGTLELFEADVPGFRLGGGNQTPRRGIAWSYLKDRNIESDPRVLFASDFSDLGKSTWQSGGAFGPEQVLDPQTRTTYLRASIPRDKLWGCDLEHNVVEGNASGLPARVENALYARYYVYLEPTWGSTVDVNKMPGLDARLGYWNSSGYWYPITGNGGERASGMKVWNATAQRWEYHGASIRGLGGQKAGDGNPYDDLFWLGSYVYHLDQATEYGEHAHWGSVVIAKGRWHCIEHYVKMNSISGPYDSIGNGTANADGEHRAWVDGVLCYERTNFRWRRHPELSLQGFWLNWYHGGREAAPAEMHFRMNSVVIARDYIGPRNDS
jgi:hypothetical protein